MNIWSSCFQKHSPDLGYLCSDQMPPFSMPGWMLRQLPDMSVRGTRFGNQTTLFSVQHHSLDCHFISGRPHRYVKPQIPGRESRDIYSLFNISFLCALSSATQTTPRVAERKPRRDRFQFALSPLGRLF